MIKKKKFYSMRIKTAEALFLALLLAFLVCLGISKAVDSYISNVYLSEDKLEARQSALVTELQTYISDNDIASTDMENLRNWCHSEHNVLLSVYRNDGMVYETEGSKNTDDIYKMDESVTGSLAYQNSEYPQYFKMKFNDGYFTISLVDFSEYTISDISAILICVVFVVIVLIVMVVFTSKVTAKIDILSKQVAEIEKGNLDIKIAVNGKDEISELAEDVDKMRNSIISKLRSEEKAWESNNELINSMSHDIRNPLTSIIGYTDLLANKQYDTPEEAQKYLDICREKAYKLKELTDVLFGYFLVFGNRNISLNFEKLNARIMFEQLFSEYIVEMRASGYKIHSLALRADNLIDTDAEFLKRFFDNLFSNLKKYSDKKNDITIFQNVEKDNIYVQLTNVISDAANKVESSGIGLKTCEKIAELLHFKFNYRTEKNIFISEIYIPVALPDSIIKEGKG